MQISPREKHEIEVSALNNRTWQKLQSSFEKEVPLSGVALLSNTEKEKNTENSKKYIYETQSKGNEFRHTVGAVEGLFGWRRGLQQKQDAWFHVCEIKKSSPDMNGEFSKTQLDWSKAGNMVGAKQNSPAPQTTKISKTSSYMWSQRRMKMFSLSE